MTLLFSITFQAWKMVFLNSMTFHDQGAPWRSFNCAINAHLPNRKAGARYPSPVTHLSSESNSWPITTLVWWSFSRTTWVTQYQNVNILNFIRPKDDGGGGDNWSYKMCKAPVKTSPSAYQHPTSHKPDALSVAAPTMSKHWREKYHIPWTCSPQSQVGSSIFVLTTKGSCLPRGRVAKRPVGPLIPVLQIKWLINK